MVRIRQRKFYLWPWNLNLYVWYEDEILANDNPWRRNTSDKVMNYGQVIGV